MSESATEGEQAGAAAAAGGPNEAQVLRVFLSSPSDVEAERDAAQREIARLGEFDPPLTVQLIRWEESYFTAREDFQAQLVRPSQTDLVVVVLWSRLGTPLPPSYARPDGSLPTGTEWEFEEAMAAAREHGAPDLLMYRKLTKISVAPDTQERARMNAELDRVEAFWRVWFRSEEGHFTAGYKPFATTEEFAAKFRGDLRNWLQDRGWLGAPAAWPVAELGSPFRGLEAFDEKHAPVFFGRRRAVEQALRKLAGGAARGCPFLLVLGASGSGKSSLARAGLAARLLRQPGAAPGVDLWRRCVVRVGALAPDGLAGLAAALWDEDALPELAQGDNASPEEFAEQLRSHPAGAAQAVRRALDRAAASSPLARQKDALPSAALLLVLDQLEDLFVQPWAGAFVAAIGALARSRAVWVAATLRADFYPAFQDSPALLRLKADGDLLDLTPPNEAELADIIRAPARAAGLVYERDPASGEGLDDRLAQAARGSGALPLLQFTLEELFKARRGDMLTLAAYEALGGLEGAIGRQAQRVIDALPEATRAVLPDVLLDLVESSRDRVGARLRLRAFVAATPEKDELLRALEAARLLVADGSGEGATIRLAHEALLTHWEAARAALDANRDFVRLRDRMDRAAREWRERERAPDELLTAERPLGEAADLIARQKSRLEPGTIEFLEASLAARDARLEAKRREDEAELAREQASLAKVAAAQARTANFQRRARWALGAVAAAVLVGIVAVVWQQLRLQTAQRIVSLKNVNLLAELADIERSRDNPDGALRLAAQGARLATAAGLAHSPESLADGALAVSVWRADWRIFLASREAQSAAFSPDGARVVTASDDGAEVWDVATGRQALALRGHQNMVYSAVFSADGSRIITASRDNTARIWDARTGKQLQVLRGHTGDVEAAVFSRDGRLAATASWDKTAKIWDANSGKAIATLSGHSAFVDDVSFSPDARRVVTASWDQTARVWDVASGRQIALLSHPAIVNSAQFSPDGRLIVTASNDGTARIWDAASGRALHVLNVSSSVVFSAAFSRDGRFVVTASADRLAKLWDAASGAFIGSLVGHEASVGSAQFSPDDTRVITTSLDKTVRIWDLTDGAAIDTLRNVRKPLFCATFSPDDRILLTCSIDGSAALWDAASGASLGVLSAGDAPILSASFSPDGTRFATASEDGHAKIWNASSGALIASLDHRGWVYSVAFSPDGTRVVTASGDKTARVWDAATGRQIVVLSGHQDAVRDAAFSPDGTRIVTASADQTARIWDAKTGKPLVVLQGHADQVFSAAFSPDGSRVVTASADKTARVWDAKTGKPIAVLRGHENFVTSAAYSPDGLTIVTGSEDGAARLWSAASGALIRTLRGHGNWIFSVAFSHDGQRVVTASADGSARVWDGASGKQILELDNRSFGFSSAAFNADASRILTVSADGSAQIWNAANDRAIATLTGEAAAQAAAFSPDGTRVVTGLEDGSAQIWDAADGKPIATFRPSDPTIDAIRSVIFSPDGKQIAAVSEGGFARLWDAATARPIAALPGPPNASGEFVAFSPKGDRLLVGYGDQTARVWDLATRQIVVVLSGHSAPPLGGAFSPDGARIVTASQDGTARVWDAATGREIQIFRPNAGRLFSAVFSPDGRRVLTAAQDSQAQIWDAASGAQIAVLRGHQDVVWTAAFSPDGTKALTASADGTTRLWDVRLATASTAALLQETCARRLVSVSTLSHDEMRLAGYPDSLPPIDVCAADKGAP